MDSKNQSAGPVQQKPKKPPLTLNQFYRQRVYTGPPRKCMATFKKLSNIERREIEERMKAVQIKYLVDFTRYSLSLPAVDVNHADKKDVCYNVLSYQDEIIEILDSDSEI